MKPRHRSIEHLIEEQARKWDILQKEKETKTVQPVIAISKLIGSWAGVIAKRVADDLNFDLFGREIIDKIAQNAKLSSAVVRTLDDKARNTLEDWLLSGVSKHMLWSDEYLQHLARVVGAVAKHGRAVIYGRGASFLLSPSEALRVLIIAPLEARIQKMANQLKISLDEAARRVSEEDEKRTNYIKNYFYSDFADPLFYDLVINTQCLSVDSSVELIKIAWESKRPR